MRSSINRKIILIGVDSLALLLVSYLSFWLRFDFNIPSSYLQPGFILEFNILVLITRILVFYLARLYNKIWRYASMGELRSIIISTFISSAIMGSYVLLNDAFTLPRSIIIIHSALTVLFIGGVRFFWRLTREGLPAGKGTNGGPRTLLIGAGDAGEMLLREIKKHEELECELIGILDDDPNKQGMEIHGHRVLGSLDELQELIQKHDVEEVIIAIPSAPGSVVRRIHNISKKEGVKVKVLPGVFKIISGEVAVDSLREVEVEDLLRREPVSIDIERICGYLKHKTVLITGGGGSIGAELMRQVASFDPRTLIVFDVSEDNVYQINREIKNKYPGLEVVCVVGNVQDKDLVQKVFRECKPQVVFHAAAFKHVPLMEYNVEEAVKNNILGTFNVVQAAHEFSAERFVFISTDKAVNPGSVMGATKRISEIMVQTRDMSSKTNFAAVRFGNVLESRGSVIPLFKEQIQNGGPITVTHREMTRYFMTIPEAIQLIIQAGSIIEEGELFILDMGKPVKILDLARDLIHLSGLNPGEDIPIEFTGLRPGEKLHEELAKDDEQLEKTRHEKIFVGKPRDNTPEIVADELKSLEKDFFNRDLVRGFIWEEIKNCLNNLWKEYEAQEPIKGELKKGEMRKEA